MILSVLVFVHFSKDLLHIRQVFPLGNAVCKISTSKCKLFRRVFLLFKTFIPFPILIAILIYEHSDGDRSRWRERFSLMSQTHIRKWRYVTAKWQLGSIKSPYLEHRLGPSLRLKLKSQPKSLAQRKLAGEKRQFLSNRGRQLWCHFGYILPIFMF